MRAAVMRDEGHACFQSASSSSALRKYCSQYHAGGGCLRFKRLHCCGAMPPGSVPSSAAPSSGCAWHSSEWSALTSAAAPWPCELAASDAAGHRISWRCGCGGGPRHGRQAMPQKRGRQRICAAGTRAPGRSRRGHLPERRLRGSARHALAARIGRCLWGKLWHRASAVNICGVTGLPRWNRAHGCAGRRNSAQRDAACLPPR